MSISNLELETVSKSFLSNSTTFESSKDESPFFLLKFCSELPDIQITAKVESLGSRGSSRSSSKSRPKSRSRSRSKSSERILVEKDQSYSNEECSGEVFKINFRLSLISKFTCFQAFMLENIRNKPGFLLEKLQAYQVKNPK